MSVIYATTLKNTRMNDVTAAIDVSAPGSLKIYQSDGTTLLAVVPLANPAATGASGGVLTFSGTPLTCSAATGTGTAAKAKVCDGTGAVVVDGLTVGTSASDINLNSTSIVAGQPVTITSATITHG
jgi:hypothetical protein